MNVHVTINDDLNDDLVWELFLAVYLHFHEIFSNFGRISYSSRIFFRFEFSLTNIAVFSQILQMVNL